MNGFRGRCAALVAVAALAMVLLGGAAPAAAQAPEEGSGPGDAPPRHRLELLGLLVSPIGGIVDEVYGSHTGLAARYGFGISPRWGLEVELGRRQASGATTNLGLPAELEMLHGALLAAYRWGPGTTQRDRWSFSVGVGLLLADVEEELRFPGEDAKDSETLAGALLRGGLRWPLGPTWGLTGEARLSLLEKVSSPGPGLEAADLSAFEVAGGVFVAF